MEGRCGFCFHPLGAAAACNVCAKAPTTTTPFGSSSVKPPSPCFSFTPTQSYSSQPARADPPATASPSGFMFSPAPPALASPSSAFSFSTPAPSFGQATSPATASASSAFSFSMPAPSFGQATSPATASPSSAFSFSTPAPSFGQVTSPATASASSAFSFWAPTPSFGQATSLPTASPSSVFSFSTPQQPSFGQATSPATASPSSAFSLSTPQQPSFGQATSPATASPSSAFRFSTPAPAIPFGFQPVTGCGQANSFFGMPIGSRTESCVFDDDEPVENPPAPTVGGVQGSQATNGPLVLKTHCELPAVARGSARERFAVLVHAKAPAATDHAPRASLDLVTVLDVSSSMEGAKLALLKEAMGFVIDKLGAADRLSIVSFSHQARRVTPLTRMSDAGKASAKLAVGSLVASGQTDILKGLDTAAKVFDGRRYKNAVASVILLSDGQDNCNQQYWVSYGAANKSYDYLVPRSLAGCKDGNRSTPIHTFGFGTHHDAKAMHGVAEATGGTYSFIENHAVVQDAFAQCIGGLLSVAVQEAWIAVACPHPDVRVRSIKSGRYESSVVAYGRAASVDVGELYADEERRFLLFVDLPRVADEEDMMCLVRVSSTYKDSATGKSMEAAGEDAVVRRPAEVTSEEDQKPSMEVQVERFRVEATEDIAAARAAAERGDHAEAARILDRRREAAGTGDMAGDARCAAVVYELAELSARVSTRREYEQTGRSSVLAGMSSHAQQRAASVNFHACMASPSSVFGSASTPAFGAPTPCGAPAFGAAFATPAMKDMVDSSRKIRGEREQQQSSATMTMPSSGSTSVFWNNGSNI